MPKILLISNWIWRKILFSSLLLESLIQESEKAKLPLEIEVLSLVGEGGAFDRWLSHPQVSLLHSSPPLPYGGSLSGRKMGKNYSFY